MRVTQGEAVCNGNFEVELVETMRVNVVRDRVIAILDQIGGSNVNEIFSTNDVGT